MVTCATQSECVCIQEYSEMHTRIEGVAERVSGEWRTSYADGMNRIRRNQEKNNTQTTLNNLRKNVMTQNAHGQKSDPVI